MYLKDDNFWECPICSRKLSVYHNSIVKGIKIELFDAALHMWIDMIPVASARKMIENRDPHKIGELFRLFRRAASYYISVNVRDRIRFDGVVEVDETKIGT